MWWPFKRRKDPYVEIDLHGDVLFLSINNGEVEIHYRNGSCTRYPKRSNLVVRFDSRDPCITVTVHQLFD